MKTLSRWKAVLVLPVLWAALLPGVVPAQSRSEAPSLSDAHPLEQLRRRLAESALSNALLPLEGAVDSSAYIVGPGDYFAVMLEGLGLPMATLPVTADGHLVLPDAGSVPVAGLTLAEARRRIRRALRAHYRNVEADVTLAQPRQFYVHVSGAVPVPGRYLAMPVARVSTVLEIAFADTSRAPVTHTVYQPSLRNVTLVRRDGSEHSLDLLRYFTTGETAHNPYLSDGDVLYVPAYDPRFASVYVDGEVPFPGAYDHRPGETVRDLLILAAGKTDPALLGSLHLTRTHADGTTETRTLTTADLELPLQPRDHLSVGTNRLPGGTATVEGLVARPGTYPIEQGTTTVQDLIERAGGLLPEAAPRLAYLERRVLPMPEVRPNAPNRFAATGRPFRLRPDSLALYQHLRLADLDFFSRTYFARELRLPNRVAVNLDEALHGDAAPVYLRDGDRLVIPRDEQAVYVFGQVVRPGFVAFAPGRDAGYYLSAAGGPGPGAGDAYVIDAATGTYRPAREAVIHSGDLLFVDRREDVADTPELQRLVLEDRRARADTRFRTFQTILQAASTAASIITLIILANR